MVRKVISRSRETRAISRSARIRQKALLSFCLDRPLAAAVLCYICKRENGTHKSSQKTNFWPFYLMRRFNGGLFFFSLSMDDEDTTGIVSESNYWIEFPTNEFILWKTFFWFRITTDAAGCRVNWWGWWLAWKCLKTVVLQITRFRMMISSLFAWKICEARNINSAEVIFWEHQNFKRISCTKHGYPERAC